MKLLICFGTRPEYIKVKPLISKFEDKLDVEVLFVKQHTNIFDFSGYTRELDLRECNNRLDSVFVSVLSKSQEIFKDISHVLIQGDTATACALSLAAFNRKIKVIHLEAGLRTYDLENPYPEELYRQLISRISDINLCPTEQNKINLEKELVHGKTFVVGNTVLDNLNNIKTSYGNKVLVTLHRRENFSIIADFFKQISELAKENPDLEFILPIHPNPEVQKYKHLLTNVNVIQPLQYDQLIDILKDTKLVITDSGGIQEECSFLNKKAIVCRKTTERQESVNIHSFLCAEPKFLKEIFYEHLGKYEVNQPCPYGDGNASDKVLSILKDV